MTRRRPSHAAVQLGHSPSSDNLHGDESGELQPGCVWHVSVNLVRLAAELSSFKQDNLRGDKEADTVIRGTQKKHTLHCLDTNVNICMRIPVTTAEATVHITEDKLNEIMVQERGSKSF